MSLGRFPFFQQTAVSQDIQESPAGQWGAQCSTLASQED